MSRATTNQKTYPTYKESGVDWLESVPAHWELRRLGDSISNSINGTWGEDPDGINDLPCIRVADFDRKLWKINLDKLTMRAITPGNDFGDFYTPVISYWRNPEEETTSL